MEQNIVAEDTKAMDADNLDELQVVEIPKSDLDRISGGVVGMLL